LNMPGVLPAGIIACGSAAALAGDANHARICGSGSHAIPARSLTLPVTDSSHLRYMLSGLAIILSVLACIDPANAPEPSESGPAALIIVGPERETDVTCVTLEGTETTGRELLELAAVPVTLDERNAMGALVCAINGQGCAYPAEQCLCQCQGSGPCAYWASFVRMPAGTWTYAGQGVSTQKLGPRALYAWVWLTTTTNTEVLDWLPSGEIESVCP